MLGGPEGQGSYLPVWGETRTGQLLHFSQSLVWGSLLRTMVQNTNTESGGWSHKHRIPKPLCNLTRQVPDQGDIRGVRPSCKQSSNAAALQTPILFCTRTWRLLMGRQDEPGSREVSWGGPRRQHGTRTVSRPLTPEGLKPQQLSAQEARCGQRAGKVCPGPGLESPA